MKIVVAEAVSIDNLLEFLVNRRGLRIYTSSAWCSTNRPLGNGRVNFRHEADGFTQGSNHLAVVLQIVIGQGSATAVLEPLFANLIAADMEIPDFARDAFEVLPPLL